MTLSAHFRQATLDDLSELQRLEAQFPGDRLSPRQLRLHVRRADGRLRVWDEHGRLCGYSLVLRRAGSVAGRLYSLVIDQSLRGRGLGEQLLDDAEAAARRAGADVMRLEVRADNAAAITLYLRTGYWEIGQRSRYYDDGVDALQLEKSLRV